MKKIRWNILLIIIIFTLSGCKSIKNQSVKIEKKDRAPSSLADISKGLQSILNNTEKIEKILDGTDFEVEKAEMEKVKEEEKAKMERTIEVKNESQKSTGGQGDGEGQSGDQSKGTQSKEQKKPQDKEEKLLNTWDQIDKKIEDIHKKWNSYEAEGMKKGVTSEMSSRFKDSLNALTTSIEGRKIIDIYDYSSQSMLNLSFMFGLYKDEILGDIDKLKYSTYQSYLNALKGDDTKSTELLKTSIEDINKIRLKLEKNNSKMKMLDKINLSIEDMSKSLKEKSTKLTRIKKDIIIKNLEELGK